MMSGLNENQWSRRLIRCRQPPEHARATCRHVSHRTVPMTLEPI